MSSPYYDAIVIGAGVMGSATAYHLGKAGLKTLVLEQFARGHTSGSSHGLSRVIRLFYDKPFYTRLMRYGYEEWRNVEAESGRKLLYTTGGLTLGRKGDSYLDTIRFSLETNQIEWEGWDAETLGERFPQFRVDSDTYAIWQKDTGFLHASECMVTLLEMAEGYGVEIRELSPVLALDLQGTHPEVLAGGERFRARSVVVTAGPWARPFLGGLNLPLTVTRQQVVYFRPKDPSHFEIGRFPVFTDRMMPDFFYGFPIFAVEGVKIARHGMGEPVTPETCDRTPSESYISRLRDYLRHRIPGLTGEVVSGQVCLYTETPDEDFILDRHPACPQVVIGAGFSGHGFKFGALVGRILSELARHGETSFDLSPFRLDRFQRTPREKA